MISSTVFIQPVIKLRPIVVVALAAFAFCFAKADPPESPWSSEFTPPETISSDRVLIEPLHPRHTELDYKAVIGNKAYLRKVLQWGGWPSDEMSLEDNRNALENHWKEFENKEAYAYSVLSTSEDTCLGCIYIDPVDKDPNTVNVYFWIIEEQINNNLEQHLAEALIQSFEDEWPVNQIEFTVPSQDPGKIKVLKKTGLKVISENETQATFTWTRSN